MILWIFEQGKSSKTVGFSASFPNAIILAIWRTKRKILQSTRIQAVRRRITLLRTRKRMTMKTKTMQMEPTRFQPPRVLSPRKSPDSRRLDPLPALQTRTIYADFSRQRKSDANSMVETILPKMNSTFCPHARVPRNER